MNILTVFNGFLGSGKTTAMMALTRCYSAHYCNAPELMIFKIECSAMGG